MKRRSLESRARDAGSAMVELVVALPMLLLVLVGTADFARVLYMTIELTNAARAGAQFGATGVSSAVDGAGMSAMGAAAAPNVNPTVTATAAPIVWCVNQAGTFRATTGPGTSYTCLLNEHLVVLVTARADKTFRLIAGIPGIPRTLDVYRNATMRVP